MRDRELMAMLRAELKDAGLYERATARSVAELVVFSAIGIAGAWLALAADDWLLRALGIFVSAIASIGVGTNTHSASHNATARNKTDNDALTFFGYPFFLGMSATWWWHKHCAVHHPAPNVVGIDGDADLHPWFAITEEDARTGSPFLRFYYRYLQWPFFPFVLGVTGFRMQQFGWRHIYGDIKAGRAKARKAWIDFFCIVGHYALWIGLPLLFFSPGIVFLVYIARVVIIGYGLFAVLGPGHWPVEAAAVMAGHHKDDYILLQTASTVNFTTGPLGRLMCCGLEYQIEHHLFPDISHPHYPKAAPIIERFCREHGYPYRSFSWTRAVWEALYVFRAPKPVTYEMETLREAPESRVAL